MSDFVNKKQRQNLKVCLSALEHLLKVMFNSLINLLFPNGVSNATNLLSEPYLAATGKPNVGVVWVGIYLSYIKTVFIDRKLV